MPTTGKLNAIDFASATVGYIVGDSTTLLKTVDGGLNWTVVNHSGLSTSSFSHRLVDVKFIDEQIGFVVLEDDNDGAFKTIDGGLTWTPASNSGSNLCFKHSVYVNSETDYFVGGAGCFQSAQVDHYSNGAWSISTINYETFNPDDYVTEMDFHTNVGLAALNGQYFLRTVDGGATWDSIPSQLNTDRKLTSVMFVSADTVYAGYEQDILPGFGFLISTDAGLTWSVQSTTGFFYPAARSFMQSNNGNLYAGGIAVNDFGIIFASTDGVTWTEETVDYPLNDMAGYGNDVAFAVGDSGYVITNLTTGTLGLSDGAETLDINVYPNPTHDLLYVESESGTPAFYNLLNLQGQVVLRGIDAGDASAVDLSHLPAGVYFLKPADGARHAVHRIVKR